jgi:hypothetical protein
MNHAGEEVSSLAFNHVGTQLATVTESGMLRLWRLLPRGEALVHYAVEEGLPPQIKRGRSS